MKKYQLITCDDYGHVDVYYFSTEKEIKAKIKEKEENEYHVISAYKITIEKEYDEDINKFLHV